MHSPDKICFQYNGSEPKTLQEKRLLSARKTCLSKEKGEPGFVEGSADGRGCHQKGSGVTSSQSGPEKFLELDFFLRGEPGGEGRVPWEPRPGGDPTQAVKTFLALRMSFRTIWSHEQIKTFTHALETYFVFQNRKLLIWNGVGSSRPWQRLSHFNLFGFRQEILHPQRQPWKWLSFFVTHPHFVSANDIGLPD